MSISSGPDRCLPPLAPEKVRGMHSFSRGQQPRLLWAEVCPQPTYLPGVSPPTHQDKLSSQGFGTDLPLVDSQVEQHNIFHNEVKAIGPHLAKDKVCTW